jgi:hypothetical protein
MAGNTWTCARHGVINAGAASESTTTGGGRHAEPVAVID